MAGKIDPAVLPHWARVAFAARCARRVQPLFAQFWPNASPKDAQNIDHAIRLAEQSAAAGQRQNGLGPARRQVLMTAGGAILSTYRRSNPGIPASDEPEPPEESAAATSFVAKAAEHAVKAAESPPEGSAGPALEAFAYALDAIDAADAAEAYAAIEGDFLTLRSRARRERWTDETPVSIH